MNKKIVLTGGGTAGHVMPNLALLPGLFAADYDVHYIGGNGIEKRLCENKSIVFHEISAEKLRRSFTPKNLLIPFKVCRGYLQAKQILKELRPNVVFSKGGFVAVPVALAAARLKIPIISHESDLTLGLANKIIYKKCRKMFCSFEETVKYGKKCEHSGSIVRREILNTSKKSVVQGRKTILVMGGSLGAAKINEAVRAAAVDLTKKFDIIHLCGKGKVDGNIKIANYTQIEFCDKIWELFAKADFVVSRAGSNSVFEFLALKKPMLLIPLSKASSRGDQILNSNSFAKKGFARVLIEEDLTKQKLISEIDELTKFTFPKTLPNVVGNEKVLKELLSF